VATVRISDVPLRDVVLACVPSLVASGVMAAVVFAFVRWTASAPPAVQLFGGAAIGGAVYAVLMAIIDRDFFSRAREHFFSRGGVLPTAG
jgi:xanthosine utilization system XapX-like protein